MKTAAIASQFLFLALGLVLLWQLVLSPRTRARRQPTLLKPWAAPLPEIFVFLFHGLAGGFLGSFLVGLAAKSFGLTDDELAITATAGLHFGAVAGLAVFLLANPAAAPLMGPVRRAFTSGIATFLIAMPFVHVTNLAWQGVLILCGVEVERQPAVAMVHRLGLSPWLAVFVLSAVVVAPIAEELLFRAGLFRGLRSFSARWIALVLPALLFAAIHYHLPSYLPLAMLGFIFALAYERTGSLGTSIVAHAIFNLNNLLLLLAGVDT